MKQPSLFDDNSQELAPARIGIGGSVNKLNKAQKQFNQAIAKIEAQLRENNEWREFMPLYQQRIANEYHPLAMRLRATRMALVELLDNHFDNQKLTRNQREKLRLFLADMIDNLIGQEESAELISLYDKYNELSHREEQQYEMDVIRTLVDDVFGIEVDSDATSPEQLMEHLHSQMHTREQPRASKRKPRKKSEKMLAREAEQAAAAQNATRAIRDVYRKLASELHPDREPDPQRRERLTELMQQANRAYEEDDLLTLLRLQLQIEQIDSQALAGLAEERLANYNRALREQSERLQQERFELIQPFLMLNIDPRRLNPKIVQRELDTDLQELEEIITELDQELVDLQEVRALKQWLKEIDFAPPDDFDVAMLLRDFD